MTEFSASLFSSLAPRTGNQSSPSQPFLLEGADNLRRIFESIQDYAIFSYGEDHVITSWNPGVERVLGFTQEEFIGRKIDEIFSEEDRANGTANLEIDKAIKEGFSLTEGIRVRKNGRRFWGSGIVRPLLNDRGEIYGFVKVLQDLTLRRQLEESLEQAKREAEEANRAKDEFIAVLSHELRSPLTPINAAVEGLEVEIEDNPTAQLFIDMIRRNLALELRLVDDLLDVTRIARGKLGMKLETFDAHAKIAETITMLKQDVEQKSLNFTADLHATRSHILADPARFQQIISNLLRNAIKFTPERGSVSITSSNDADSNIVIEVRDTGIGMDEAGLARIFRPFVQGMPNIARMYGGLGLGLTIARALSETFGGQVNATSPGLGKGTTFTVLLPTSDPVDADGADGTASTTPSSRQRATLLLLDDQPDARLALKALLEQRGYEVDVADCIKTAVELIDTNNYDIVLSDIQLEGESGWDLLAAVHKPIRAIAVSALGTPANVETSMRAGFIAHIVKPYKISELDKLIQESLVKTEVR
jgi:PAS domain S-box-containing protein